MTKTCQKCEQRLPLSEFHRDKKRKDGRHSYCKNCASILKKVWYKKNRTRLLKKMKLWQKENIVKHKELTRKSRLKHKYNLTIKDYIGMLQKQNGVCCICKNPETQIIKGALCPLSVDHNHTTGKVRGLLCAKCNSAIGLMQDSPAILRTAADYLEREE